MHPTRDYRGREYVQRSLGCHVVGAALPMADPHDIRTLAAGVCKRFACRPPAIDQGVVRRLRSFVRLFIRKIWSPLRPEDLLSVEEWLENSHYSGEQRAYFRQLDEDHPQLRRKDYDCVMFEKRETLSECKHARLINSRSDVFKVKTGRWFASIEKYIFGEVEGIEPSP